MYRRWILWFLLTAFVWAVFSRLPELERLGETLLRGRWEWVLAAAGLQVCYYLAVGLLYRSAFLTVGLSVRPVAMLTVLLASLFVNTIAPSGGMAGSALFVDEAVRRGQPGARAAAGALLARIVDSTAFTVWMLVGFAYLLAGRDLKPFEIAGAAGLVAMTGTAAGLLVLGLSRPRALERVLDAFARVVNHVMTWSGRAAPLHTAWAKQHAEEFARAGVALGERPQRLMGTLAVAIAGHGLDLLSLYALFAAFRQPTESGLVIAVYAMGILFWKVSPVPEGVGVVESVLVLAMTSVGVPAPRAAAIALSFRGLTYWLPLLIGFVMVRRLRMFQPAPVRIGEESPRITAKAAPLDDDREGAGHG
ncbi:MAG: lysylphosphatidylglycerol synthase transmembrane domain-containing protein [Armatimonadota bacterium]|nr:lysylphosphatidylglycerol synthase transmembrane domain-containing protein [Armatimonadota bacterium]